MSQLDGKVAVITGGASGIGAATVRRFVAEGASVVIADILDERGEELAAELGDAAVYARTDVTDEDALRSAVAAAVAAFGRLDCMFNNAGLAGNSGPIEALDAAEMTRVVAVLLHGVLFGMKHAAPVMKAQGSGSIINTASVAGIQAGFGPHVYSACKAAVLHASRSVAVELGESGVRVNAICPGGITTPIFGRQFGLSDAECDAKLPVMDEMLAHMQPIRRPGQPRDIADAAVWLASDASTFVNGHALVVDGGLTSGRGWSKTQKVLDRMREALTDEAE